MKINPVSGYGVYQSYIRLLSFRVGNDSEVSGVYKESIAQSAGRYSVDASRPVSYPGAQSVSSASTSGRDLARAHEVSDAYNRIASRYYGETVAYGSGGEAKGYEAEGRIFDKFV